MKYLITSLFAALALTLSVLASADEAADKVLKIYKTEFTQYSPATCDDTSSKGYIYEGQLNGSTYIVTRVIAWDKSEFVIIQDSMAEEYFFVVSAAGEVAETHHADWDAKLENVSPGFFGLIHNTPNDCEF